MYVRQNIAKNRIDDSLQASRTIDQVIEAMKRALISGGPDPDNPIAVGKAVERIAFGIEM